MPEQVAGPVQAVVGQRIREARQRRGWSQKQLAEALDCTQTTVSHWESGHRTIGVDDVAAVAGELGVSTADLMPPDAERPAAGPDLGIIAQFGQENLEVILETYRAFVGEADTRALLAWTIRDGLDDLLMPLFRAALIAIIRDPKLSEIADRLAEMEAFDA